jgi:hypothetical protein
MRLSKLAALCVCAFLVRASLARAGDTELFPIPSPEERAQFQKSHLKIGGMSAPLSAEETAVAAAQDDVDIQHYFLVLEFIPATRRVQGTVTVTAKSLVNGTQHLVLDLFSNMLVSTVKIGATALTFTRPGNLVDITLDRAYNIDETFAVQLAYSGVPDSTGFGSISWQKSSSAAVGTAVSTLSEPDGARTWWPCKDRPDDKATVEEWWTVPSSWMATGNGTLIGTVVNGGTGKTQYKWKPHDPLTTYLVSVSATAYATFSQTYTTLTGTSMPVDHFVYPEHLSAAQVSFSQLPAMIAFYAQKFGEYPFVEDKYGMSEFSWGGAMEHSTNTSYGTALVNGGHNYDFVMAHELSHQWWGDTVSPQTWADVWLNEGFATYSESLWAENIGGPAQYQSYTNSYWRSSFTGSVYNPVDLFGATVYDKGGWVQHMLRHVVGDANFFAALRDWYANHTDGNGNTAQYQATQEARYGGSLDWFFQQWVYGTGQPRYEYGWTTANLGNGTYRTYVRVRQTQTPATVFTMPIDVTLLTPGGNQVRTLQNDQLDEDFILDTSVPVTGFNFDEKDWILRQSRTFVAQPDADADGVPDRLDNCANGSNPVQADFDQDGAGDVCDPDDDNDGLADGFDCAPLDGAQGSVGLVTTLSAANAGGVAHLTWDAAARAETYDIQRGALAELALGSYGACWATEIAVTAYDDPEIPAIDEGYFYLVRGHDVGCGEGGSLGTDGAGVPRPSACP